MKTLFSLLIVICFTTVSQAQITTKLLTGSWKVVKVTEMPKEESLKKLARDFERSTFEFGGDKVFAIRSRKPGADFEQIVKMTKGTKWQLDKKNKVRIGNKADNYSIMGIVVKQENEKTYFVFDETDITLEVKKR